MNEGEYLEMCNQLKQKYDEIERREERRKRENFRLKRSLLFYISLLNAVKVEMENSGMDITGTVNALFDVLMYRGNEDLEQILDYEGDSQDEPITPPILLMGVNVPRATVTGTTTRESSSSDSSERTDHP
jgi:hypothetical protein